jgi:CO dehydrogenase maturation factor
MKLAITGKGGVGKSSLAAGLALLLARRGYKVLAVDADPDANLASALGIPAEEQKKIIPISKQTSLIEERTGAKIKQYGQMFKLNPEVSDIADTYALWHKNVALLVLGAIDEGGAGCACPENVLIRALVSDLILHKNETLILDMEAGIEHLGRATASGVDKMIVVVEPGQRSIDTAFRLIQLGKEIGLSRFAWVANKVINKEDEIFIKNKLNNTELIGIIPYTLRIRDTDQKGGSILDGLNPELISCFENIVERLVERQK